MTLKLENLSKPSNRQYKKIADFFLYTLPMYQAAVVALPISDNAKVWIGFGLTFFVITIKGLTKFTTNEADSPTP